MKKPLGIYAERPLVPVPAYSRFPETKVCRTLELGCNLRSFEGLGLVPTREQIVHCLILAGERDPGDGHREFKFAVIRFASS
jgi:hypothetical protein